MAADRAADTVTPRVKTVHAQTRRTLALAAGFALAAAVAVFAPHETGAWLPLHLFMVGALLLAISGATRLFTVTWSAGEPVTGPAVAAQRGLVAVGAAGLAVGRELDWPVPVIATAGLCVTTGLVLLGGLLVVEVRTAKVRRFHPAVTFYLTAVGFGIVGTVLGAALVTGRGEVRDAHVIVNLLGLVGLVIAGTLPFFVATQARMKMHRRATPRRLHVNVAWLALSTAVAAIAAFVDAQRVEAVVLVAYGAGLAHLATLLPRPDAKQWRWAGPRLMQLGAGFAWWTAAVLVAADHAFVGQPVFPESLVIALVVGGFVQILVASLAYLAPVLRGGGHQQLSDGFAITRSWVALAATNVAGVAWVTDHATVTRVAIAVLAIDVLWRAGRLAYNRTRHDADPSTSDARDRSVVRV